MVARVASGVEGGAAIAGIRLVGDGRANCGAAVGDGAAVALGAGSGVPQAEITSAEQMP